MFIRAKMTVLSTIKLKWMSESNLIHGLAMVLEETVNFKFMARENIKWIYIYR